MSHLERSLSALDVAWPETPDVAPAVVARLGEQQRLAWWRRRLAVFGAVVVVGGGGLAASPAGSSLLDALGVSGGEHIRRVASAPATPPGPLPARTFAPGPVTTLARARSRAAFTVRVPSVLGAPARVRFSDAIPGGLVTLAWRGVVLSELQGGATAYVQKEIGPRTKVVRTHVGGARAVYLRDPRSFVFVEDRDRTILPGTAALAHGDVLVWDTADGVAHRLEVAHGGLHAALRIARALR